MLYTLKRVSRQDKVSAAGKNYVSMGIQVTELGDVWINGFGGKENASWKEGDKIEIEIYDEEYNGKTSKKFKTPTLQQSNNKMLEEMGQRVYRIEKMVEKIGKKMFEEEDTYPKRTEDPAF